jgi:uncharacterized protein (DUF1684 family)
MNNLDDDTPADTDDAPADYVADLQAKREEKDEFFSEHPQSPIPPEHRDSFSGLDYFDPEPDYRVDATVTRHDDPDPVPMETTAGNEVRYVRIVTFAFDLDNHEHELQGYKQRPDDDDEPIFVPFRDKTTGQESYRGGRYVELHPEDDIADGETVTLDFNLAYTPFCSYTDTFSCPLPPEENWLDVEVRAGEREWSPET